MPATEPGALSEKAPAKVNLTLHIRARRDDGYHDLESLVAFAGVHDILSLDPGAALSIHVPVQRRTQPALKTRTPSSRPPARLPRASTACAWAPFAL